MCPLSIQTSKDIPIRSVEDWFRFAPPKKGRKQWKDGRSAKELAKAWFKTGVPRVPEELQALFKSHPDTKDLVVETGIPEMVTRLDNFKGGHRNHDLILRGHVGDIRTLVAVEAKADEPFGKIAQEYYREKVGTRSKVPCRIAILSCSIFGRPIDEGPGQLRYQLLHGLGGALIEAKNQRAAQAVLVVHEFISDEVEQDRIDQNAADFERFVRTFPGWEETIIRAGTLIGPIQIPGPGGEFVPRDIPFLIGKATTNLI
jgi:hypothetical protein